MYRIPKFGVLVLALVLIAAVSACALVCQTAPIIAAKASGAAKASAHVPPCHPQPAKPSTSSTDCSHPQDALLSAAAILDFDGVAFTVSPIEAELARGVLAVVRPGVDDASRSSFDPPLCLRV